MIILVLFISDIVMLVLASIGIIPFWYVVLSFMMSMIISYRYILGGYNEDANGGKSEYKGNNNYNRRCE